MSIDTFTPKKPGELENFSLDFSNNLSKGEIINSASAAISVNFGTDPGVGTMLFGVPRIDGTTVIQQVQNGVADVDYLFELTVQTSSGQTLIGSAILPVRVAK